MTVSKEAARRLMMLKQGIFAQNGSGKKDIYDAIDDLGCVQIDAISVVERAHYLTLWTRLGDYDKNYLWELAYKDRHLFEYMAHAASYIPFKDYRYYLHAMNVRKGEIEGRFKKWGKTDPELINNVLERIDKEGPLSSKDFEGPKRIGGWWNWKPAKLALELLYGAGILLIDHRENFQKYYDLSENIVPNWVDIDPPEENERVQFFIIKTLGCLGLTKPQEIRSYYHDHSVKLGMRTSDIQDYLGELVSDDFVVKFEVDWDKDLYYCLPEDHDLVSGLSDDPLFDGVQLVGYFDNLMWIRERISLFFDFEPKLEIYLPNTERVYGYYHFPVIYGDRIVARIEPKMDRSEKKLLIVGYWLEDGFESTEEYEDRLWDNLESFASFNGADEIIWDQPYNT
ncbi:hypothetical protein GF319_10070 [Candidatus Bathyarchaeota archaeon]|nr:hypothetical protein [Candidatus Bathyarchaeota archaeon]